VAAATGSISQGPIRKQCKTLELILNAYPLETCTVLPEMPLLSIGTWPSNFLSSEPARLPGATRSQPKKLSPSCLQVQLN
jgi:hypothetical protein